MNEFALRNFLVGWEFWMLETQFIAVLVALFLALRSHPIRPRTAALAILIGITAWAAAGHIPPRTSRIFFDEQIYQSIAQNLSDEHTAQMCDEGHVDTGRLRCIRGEYNKEPYGYAYLISLAYRGGGVSDAWAFRLNNLAMGLTAATVYALSLLLFQSSFAAITASVIFMLLPMQLTWSNTAASEPTAALLCGTALLMTVWFARFRSLPILAAAVATTAFATTMRPENLLVVPIVCLSILLLAPEEYLRRRTWIGALGGLLLVTPTILHFLAVRNEPWGATTTRMSWQYLVTNAPVNLRFYFADPRFPALMGIAALVGAMARTRIKQRLVVLAYLLAFWTIYALFYAGSYNYGADVRYSLMTYIPVAVLAGLGIERIATGIRSRAVPAASNRTLLAGVLALLLIQFSWYLPLVRETGEEAWGARADVEYAKEFAAALPKDSFVLTHNPSMFFVWGLNAGQLSIASTEPDYVERVLLPRYAGGVYVHWNFWCNVSDPVQVEFCQKTLAIFPHDLVNQRTLRDYRFALYRLKPR